jgi:hypothetical protein
MTPCPHESFAARVDVIRLTDSPESAAVTGYTTEIHIECAQCGRPLAFACPEIGSLNDRPTASPDGLELRAPLVSPDGYTPAMPGFRLREAGT